MTNGINRPRAFSAPVELREKNKYKNKTICKEDLEIFLALYQKKSKSLKSMIFGLPAEMRILQIIINDTKSQFTNRTPISDANKEIISNMIAMNKEHRAEKKTHELRLRDLIIDKMIDVLCLENMAKYVSFADFL